MSAERENVICQQLMNLGEGYLGVLCTVIFNNFFMANFFKIGASHPFFI